LTVTTTVKSVSKPSLIAPLTAVLHLLSALPVSLATF
jgi:hypothetical protein